MSAVHGAFDSLRFPYSKNLPPFITPVKERTNATAAVEPSAPAIGGSASSRTPGDPRLTPTINIEIPLMAATLDRVLQGVAAVPSATFHELHHGYGRTLPQFCKLFKGIHKPARFVVHVRKHWVAAELTDSEFLLFDSAPSEPVRRDLRRDARKLGFPAPTFVPVPTQIMGSEQCGLFAIMYVLARHSRRPIPRTETKLCLASLQRCPDNRFKAEAFKLLDAAGITAGARQLTHKDVRDRLEKAEVGTRLVHTFRFVGADTLLNWHGTIQSIEKSNRGSLVYTVEYDPVSLDDDLPEDTDELEQDRGLAVLPHPRSDGIQTLEVELLASLPASEISSYTRDYPALPTTKNKEWSEYLGPPRYADTLLTGQHFLDFGLLSFEKITEKMTALSIPWSASTTSTRRTHVAELTRLRDFIEKLDSTKAPLSVLITQFLQDRRTEGELAWSTVSRVTGTLIGAFQSLPYYTTNGVSLNVGRWHTVKDALTTANRLSASEGTHEPTAAKPQQVATTVGSLMRDKHLAEACALSLCWYSAQRPCDTLLVRTAGLSSSNGDQWKARFQEGKVIGKVEAYHIHFRVPNKKALEAIKKYHLSRKRGKHKQLFEFASAYRRSQFLTRIRQALREVDPSLELRSLRRGSLQTYAEAGVSESALLAYSRHTSVQMLRRYLGWEAVVTDEHKEVMSSAEALATVRGGEPASSFTPQGWIEVTNSGTLRISSDHPPPAPASYTRVGLPIHIKSCTRVPLDIDEISRLALDCPTHIKTAWEEDRLWLTDHTRYEYGRPPDLATAKQARLQRTHIAQLIEVDHIAPVDAEDEPLITGLVDYFTVDEKQKGRTRGIQHPAGHNSYYCNVKGRPNSTRRSSRTPIFARKGCTTYDMSGYYTQFEVSTRVSYAHCFKSEGKWYRFKRLVTGARWSTNVATSATKVLAWGGPESVAVDTCIDNVRFAGDAGPVTAAAWNFVQRCQKCRVQLNAGDGGQLDVYGLTKQDVAAAYRKIADFFGEVADYTANTIKCRDRHVARVGEYLAAAERHTATYSTHFGLYALLLYMSETLGVPLQQWHSVRLWFARRARDLGKNHSLWSKPPTVHAPLVALRRWVAVVSKNKPARVVEAPTPKTVVFIDACGEGFAAIIVPPSSSPYLIQHAWSRAEMSKHRLHHSTNSEPEAIVRVSRLLAEAGDECPLFVSDHEQFAWALTKGSSLSQTNDERLAQISPWARVAFEPGRLNLADKYSRFQADMLLADDAAEASRRAKWYLSSRICGPAYGIVGSGRSRPSRTLHTERYMISHVVEERII